MDEGWGRQAVDFATLSEPGNCREYVALHRHVGVGAGVRLLDIACGAGLAVELAAAQGALCSGIDASARLIDIARDRLPDADLRVGDMHALPWADSSFDVVTSFRGIWGTTPDAVDEAKRVLAPGGRLGMTVWGHIKKSPGAWALKPFTLATPPKVANQAAMNSLGRPGVGEDLLHRAGFVDIERVEIPFVWEFADPESYARALASTGPAFEAIQGVGEEAFIEFSANLARERVRAGLPLRAEIAVVGFTGRKRRAHRRAGDGIEGTTAISERTANVGFLAEPETTPEAQQQFDADLAEVGYVMNVSRLWAHQPSQETGLFALLGQASAAAGLTFRQRGILVAASTSAIGDRYCSLSWGGKLAGEVGADVAASVLRGEDDLLDASDRALARWARQVATDAGATRPSDLDDLRSAGFDDSQILAITFFVTLRVAFASVNGALGVLPDHQLGERTPSEVLDAVTFGRPMART